MKTEFKLVFLAFSNGISHEKTTSVRFIPDINAKFKGLKNIKIIKTPSLKVPAGINLKFKIKKFDLSWVSRYLEKIFPEKYLSQQFLFRLTALKKKEPIYDKGQGTISEFLI